MLHNFTGTWRDGAYAYAGVILDGSGNIFGTTVYGGAWNFGAVYKVDTKGKFTLLHSFIETDGAQPYAPLIMDASGNLYGSAVSGASSNNGAVFKLAPR